MSSPEVEKIGIANPAYEAGDASGSNNSDGSEMAEGQGSGSSLERPPLASRRVHPVLLLALLLTVAGLAWAYGNEVQRADQLENRVSALGHELDRVHSELLAHEQQMSHVRTAVDDLTGRMSALQTLVNQPPSTSGAADH